MAEKLSGIEMMMQSLLKAAGFDPDAMRTAIDKTVNDFMDAINRLTRELSNTNARLVAIETDLQAIKDKLGIATFNGADTPLLDLQERKN
jgi:hypothetical protein